jgi:hypothetical protein
MFPIKPMPLLVVAARCCCGTEVTPFQRELEPVRGINPPLPLSRSVSVGPEAPCFTASAEIAAARERLGRRSEVL